MMAFNCGGARAAICKVLKPPQEMPRMPTAPFDHGCAASQAMTSSPSACSCFVYSPRSSPSESPEPRMSTRA
jgi:hypothetical protein